MKRISIAFLIAIMTPGCATAIPVENQEAPLGTIPHGVGGPYPTCAVACSGGAFTDLIGTVMPEGYRYSTCNAAPATKCWNPSVGGTFQTQVLLPEEFAVVNPGWGGAQIVNAYGSDVWLFSPEATVRGEVAVPVGCSLKLVSAKLRRWGNAYAQMRLRAFSADTNQTLLDISTPYAPVTVDEEPIDTAHFSDRVGRMVEIEVTGNDYAHTLYGVEAWFNCPGI